MKAAGLSGAASASRWSGSKLGARLGPWWQRRAPRERWLLLGGVIAAVLVALDTFWTSPLSKQLRRATAELVEREEALNKAAPAGQPAAEEVQGMREQEAALRKRLQAAQSAANLLGQQTADLPQLLRTLTAQASQSGQAGQTGSLRLLSLELQPDPSWAQAVSSSAVATPAAAAPTPTPGSATVATTAPAADGAKRRLYRLPVNLSVSGSYRELQSLMQTIEREAPSLQWQSMSLDSSDWPAIRLTLRAQAVSTRPTWGSSS